MRQKVRPFGYHDRPGQMMGQFFVRPEGEAVPKAGANRSLSETVFS